MTPACNGAPDGTVMFTAAWRVEDGRVAYSDYRTAGGEPDPITEAIWGGDWDWQKID